MQQPSDLSDDSSLQFIGNATVLIRYAGFTLLTDPNFIHRGEKVGLGYGLTAERLTDPALDIDQLPDVDAVVLSHWHGDHFDQVAQERLDRDLPIITTPHAAKELAGIGFRLPVPLETWSTHELLSTDGTLRITALPGKHGPTGLDLALPDVMGSCLEFERHDGARRTLGTPDLRVYVTGDTLMFEGIADIAERVPQIDVALIHLGGTRVMGVTVTLDAEQGLDLLQTVRPALAVPIHYNDYDVFKSPLSDFTALVRDAGLDAHVAYVTHGDVLPIGQLERMTS